MPFTISHSAKTDVGLKRHHNEDCFCADPDLGLYIICDGMGGENAGEVASALAVEAIQAHMIAAARRSDLPFIGPYNESVSPVTNRLASAVRWANQTIHRESQERPHCAGMGTTVVAAQLADDVLSIAHVGDSRLYLIRQNELQALTIDHSWVAEQVLRGLLTEEEAEHSPRKNIVTRALGVEDTVEVELGEVPVIPGDVFLLCSDGLTKGVHSPEILKVLREENTVHAMADRLVTLANQAGGDDNTTVLIVTVQPGNHAGLWERFRARFF